MSPAPYIIRDPDGNYHPYDLETVGAGPYGVQLIVWLEPEEALSSADLLAAIQTAIKSSGQWTTLKGAKNVRDRPDISGSILETLPTGAQVEVVETRYNPAYPAGTWSKLLHVKVNGVLSIRLRGAWFYSG